MHGALSKCIVGHFQAATYLSANQITLCKYTQIHYWDTTWTLSSETPLCFNPGKHKCQKAGRELGIKKCYAKQHCPCDYGIHFAITRRKKICLAAGCVHKDSSPIRQTRPRSSVSGHVARWRLVLPTVQLPANIQIYFGVTVIKQYLLSSPASCLCRQPVLRDRTQKQMVLPTNQNQHK